VDATTKKKVDECYDRLTNPKNYHGMYKERFKEKGLLAEPTPAKSPAKPAARSPAKPAPPSARSPAAKSPAVKSPAKSPAAKGKPSPSKPAAKGSPVPKVVPRTPAAASPAPAAPSADFLKWESVQIAPVSAMPGQQAAELFAVSRQTPSSGRSLWRFHFQRFDVNHNNVLSLAEVDKALGESFPELFKNKAAMMRAFKAADRSGNGWLSKSEFAYLLSLLHEYNQLGKAFSQLDANHDHRLSAAEFVAGCKAAGVSGDDAHLQAEFGRIDTNHG
jgi:Ca2+-binding EF-hand superfamily protein